MQWLEYSSQLYKAPVVPWFGAPIKIRLSPFPVFQKPSSWFKSVDEIGSKYWWTVSMVRLYRIVVYMNRSIFNKRFMNEELFLVQHVLLMSIQRMKSEIINYYSQVLEQTKPLNQLISRSIIQTPESSSYLPLVPSGRPNYQWIQV